MGISERINEFIAAEGLNRARFERLAGLSNGYVKKLKSAPSVEKCDLILSAFPQLSRDWLLYGIGEMYNEAGRDFVNQSNENGDNISGSNITVNKPAAPADPEYSERREFLALLKAKDAQMDRLIAVIEKLSEK